jgi:hypothetical protein
MVIHREFSFPSSIEASDFVASLIKQGIQRYAWHDRDQVEVVLEDDRKKSLVDDLAKGFEGTAGEEWADK